jgi:general secretion pathway protein D
VPAGVEQTEVQVSIDKRSNTVIVSATADQQTNLIGPLIKEIDTTPIAVVTDLRTFRLQNASPVDLAAILQAIFAQQQQQNAAAGQGGGGGRGGGGGGGGGMPPWAQQLFQQQATAGSGPTDAGYYQPQPKFTVDARTNALIAAATPSQMKLIEALVHDLDQDATYRQSVLVVPLKNADATNVAKVLTDLLNAANTNAARAPATGAAQGSTTTALAELTGDVKVVADPDANALVLTTSPKNFPRLRMVIQDLDRLRREVLLECIIAEVTLDSKGELGVQWSSNFTRSVEGAVGGTQTVASALGLDSLTQGFKYTSTSNRVGMIIHALQTDGKLNVLASPKILALENQAAEINIGQQVPYVTNSRITQNGDTVNTIQYQSVGVILKVTPHLNDAGDVRMIVHPEVSQIGPQSEAVQITANVTSPVFEKNYADTTIVVRDGESAIMGGMIRDDLTETVNKMPVLGDIPLLGLVFRDKQWEKKKVELVVFLTPHVIDDAEQMRRRTRATSEKFVLVPPELLKDELDRWTRGLDENSAVAHYNRGTVYLESGRILEAIEELSIARDMAPRDAATHFNLGLALAKKGDLEPAEAELRATAQLDPRDAETHYNLGAVLWRKQDFAGAAREFKTALQLEPSHEDARRWVNRAEAAARDFPDAGSRAPGPAPGESKAPDANPQGGNQ